jgi:hypothetical protein
MSPGISSGNGSNSTSVISSPISPIITVAARHTSSGRSAPVTAPRALSPAGARQQIPPSADQACAGRRTRTAHSATGGAAFRSARRRVFAALRCSAAPAGPLPYARHATPTASIGKEGHPSWGSIRCPARPATICGSWLPDVATAGPNRHPGLAPACHAAECGAGRFRLWRTGRRCGPQGGRRG